MADNTSLEGFLNTQDLTISNILLENLILFYDWGFIDKGGFYNINMPASGIYGGDKSVLKNVTDPNYANGKVWQANRGNWVWETGTTLGTPISISGVYVNGALNTTGYNIDYKNGKVIFDSPVSVSSNVKLQYSQKYINVVPSRGIPWLRQIQQFSNRVDDRQFTFSGSGEWAILGQTRVQIPAIAIEVLPPKELNGYQLGGGKNIYNDVIFHVITGNDWQCSNILDQISLQNERDITLFNPNRAMASGVYPFDKNGYLRQGALPSGLYPNLVKNFNYRKCFIHDTRAPSISQLSPDLYIGTIRCSTEVRD